MMHFFSIYGLVFFFVALCVVFSIILPNTFPTAFNIRSILNQQSVVVLLALAAMVPMATNQFDMSIGYLLGLTHILMIGLMVYSGMPWWVAALIIILIGVAFGYFNGILVTRVGIDAFIATLGSGTILYGCSYWYTGGQQVLGNVPKGFTKLDAMLFGNIPLPAVFVLIVAVILWLVFEYLPIGRYLHVLGANPKAAELTGISTTKYITLAFITSSTLTAIAGIILAAELRVGQTSVGPDYLLPSFAGALLGATTIRPGRMNVWGTVIAVMLLAVAVSGLQQMGAKFFAEPIFNGSMLILAVALATYATKRRMSAAAPDAVVKDENIKSN